MFGASIKGGMRGVGKGLGKEGDSGKIIETTQQNMIE